MEELSIDEINARKLLEKYKSIREVIKIIRE